MSDAQSPIYRFPVEVRQESRGVKSIAYGTTVEVDKGGMALTLDQELTTDGAIIITLKHPELRPLTVSGKVLWCEQSSDAHWDSGVIVKSNFDHWEELVEWLDRRVENSRRSKRLPIRIPISFTSQKRFYEEYTKNMSTGGLFIRSDNPPPELSEIDLAMTVPGLERTISVKAKVVFVLRAEQATAAGHPPGFGVEFVQFRQSDDLLFFTYINKLKQQFGAKK